MIFGGLLLVVAVIIAVAGGCGKGKSGGNSESYEWGTMAGNSAVTLVNEGVPLEQACTSTISMASMWADDPILNQTPPPKNFNSSDARQGCLDQLHKRLGY
jgi:hypothetical protein